MTPGDTHNNIGRHCRVANSDRVWKVIGAFGSNYVLRNIKTNDTICANLRMMTELY